MNQPIPKSAKPQDKLLSTLYVQIQSSHSVHTRELYITWLVYILFFCIESTGEEPTWNFWKYLVDPKGKTVKAWDSTVPVEEIKPHVTELVRNIILKKKDEL